MKTPQKGPFKAWLRTLPVALGLPLIVWILTWAISDPNELIEPRWSVIKVAGIVLGISVLVHFVAYCVTGLPLFLVSYREASSPIWMPSIGIPLGAILGVFAMGVLVLILDRGGNELWQPYLFLMGAGYGTATAIAAWLQRPTHA